MARKPHFITEETFDSFLALVKAGDLDGICAAVAEGFDLNAYTHCDLTLLSDLVRSLVWGEPTPNRHDTVKELIRLGADASMTNFDGSGPLFDAALSMDTEMVRILLDAGANPNPYQSDYRTKSLYDFLEDSYRFDVWGGGRGEGIFTPTEADRASEEAWLAFLDKQAIAHGKRRPDYLILLRERGAKTTQELSETPGSAFYCARKPPELSPLSEESEEGRRRATAYKSAKRLLDSATVVSEADATGHGNHWGVFTDDVSALMQRWLGTAIAEAKIPNIEDLGIEDMHELESLEGLDEPQAVGLLYTGVEKGVEAYDTGATWDSLINDGLMAVIHVEPGADGQPPKNELWSAYPFFHIGSTCRAEVERIELFPNRLEARLQLKLASGVEVTAFDAMFWRYRGLYREGATYEFALAGLAYRMEPASEQEFSIKDPEFIRLYNAQVAWVKTHGAYRPTDKEAALAAWKPSSPDDLKPICFDTSEMTAFIPDSTYTDEFSFQGRVVDVAPHAVNFMDTNFWRTSVVVLLHDERHLMLDIYVAERLFPDDWRPGLGEFVSGVAWLQTHVYGIVRDLKEMVRD
jgi:hypothetical protein